MEKKAERSRAVRVCVRAVVIFRTSASPAAVRRLK